MPAGYVEFERYWDRMIGEMVIAHPTAKYGVGYVTKGYPCPKGVPPVLWRALSSVFNPVAAFFMTVYGSDDDNPGQQVRDFHREIKGTMPSQNGSAMSPRATRARRVCRRRCGRWSRPCSIRSRRS